MTFNINCARPFNEELMAEFLDLLLATPGLKTLLNSEHFSVNGTLPRV